jgi:hypothetical protein
MENGIKRTFLFTIRDLQFSNFFLVFYKFCRLETSFLFIRLYISTIRGKFLDKPIKNTECKSYRIYLDCIRSHSHIRIYIFNVGLVCVLLICNSRK